MIKIDKGDIPASLRVPVPENFENGKTLAAALTTTASRQAMLEKGKYIENDRYKQADIKAALISLYHNKCAYCQQETEQFHAEHYRPKNTYYWLAASWDNLLLSCSSCNINKGSFFPVQYTRREAAFTKPDINLQTELHNGHEAPYLINPEIDNPAGHIYFDEHGTIYSGDLRFHVTIRTCKIDRTYLNDLRKSITDDFLAHLNAEVATQTDKIALRHTVIALLSAFRRDTKKERPFSAYREYALRYWLREALKAVLV